MTQQVTETDERHIFRFRHLAVNWQEMTAEVDGRQVHLTPIEFRLLSLLVRRRGWVIPYAQILREVWGPSYVGDRANLKLYIWYLRRKIERDPGNPELILTRRGIGYLFGPRSLDSAA